MKKLSILFISAGVVFVSCNKLKEDPASIITTGQFYETGADAIAAVNAVYSTLHSDPAGDFPIYGRNLNLLLENGSDNQVFSPSNTNPDVRALGTTTYVASNDRIKKIWQQHYYGISRANVAIDRIPEIQFDTTQRSRLVREAKFVRALLYFNLVRLYGDVPLILHDPSTTNVDQLKVPRTSKAEVYQQIINDLTDANLLPNSYTGGDIGRATSGAAHALLAKVYVTRKEWTSALSELQKVLTAGTFPGATGPYNYTLFENYKDAFQKPTKNGKEHIFSVQFETALGARNSTQNLSGGNFNSFNISTWPGDLPADGLPSIFEAEDKRKDVTFFIKQLNPTTGKVVTFNETRFAKFIDFSLTPLTNQAQSGINYPVIRYADILLLYAEVLNELNGGPTVEAFEAINKVRARSGLSLFDEGFTQDEFRDAIFLERRKEFVQEGQRWFDLVRRGGTYLYDALKQNPAKIGAHPKDTLYPIPQVEIELNEKLTQNPGW